MAVDNWKQITRRFAQYWWVVLAVCALGILVFGDLGAVSNQGVYDDIVVRVWASTSCTNAGKTVAMRATVANTGTKTRTVEMQNSPAFDLCVGSVGYQKCWSDDKHWTPEVTRLELKPGQAKTIEMNWIALIGAYGVVADYVYASEFRSDHVGTHVDLAVEPDCLAARFRVHR